MPRRTRALSNREKFHCFCQKIEIADRKSGSPRLEGRCHGPTDIGINLKLSSDKCLPKALGAFQCIDTSTCVVITVICASDRYNKVAILPELWFCLAGYQPHTPGDLSLSPLINQSKSSPRANQLPHSPTERQQGQIVRHLAPFRRCRMGLETGFTCAVKSMCQEIP